HFHSRLDESSAVFRPVDGGSVALLEGGEGIQILSRSGGGLRLLDADGREQRALSFRDWRAGRTGHGAWFEIPQVDGGVRLLDEAGKLLGRVGSRGKRPPDLLAVSPDHTRVALSWRDSLSEQNSFAVYELATGKELVRCVGHAGMIHDFAFNPDGTQIA